jgi:hypothetical protein
MAANLVEVAGRPGLLRIVIFGRAPTGTWRRASMLLSLLAALGIWFFFIRTRGWEPPAGMSAEFSAYVHWGLLTYLGVQLTMLIWTGAGGSRAEVWIDTLTSLIPAVLIFYILALHWNHFEELPLEQLRFAKSTALTMGIDFIVDFGVAIATQKRSWTIHR